MEAARAAVVGDVVWALGSPPDRGAARPGGGRAQRADDEAIERRAGIIEHMTPDMASVVGALGGCHSSREVVRILWRTGLVPPGRAFVEKRGSRLAEGIAVDAAALAGAARTNETIPAGVASASCGLDRMSVRVNGQATADSPPPRRKRTKPYKRQAPAPQEAHWRKAWAASMSLYDREGEELRTIMYAAESTTDIHTGCCGSGYLTPASSAEQIRSQLA